MLCSGGGRKAPPDLILSKNQLIPARHDKHRISPSLNRAVMRPPAPCDVVFAAASATQPAGEEGARPWLVKPKPAKSRWSGPPLPARRSKSHVLPWAPGPSGAGCGVEPRTRNPLPRSERRSSTGIDTAPAYGFGRSEEIVGKALGEGHLRSRVLIATKTGLEWSGGRVFREDRFYDLS